MFGVDFLVIFADLLIFSEIAAAFHRQHSCKILSVSSFVPHPDGFRRLQRYQRAISLLRPKLRYLCNHLLFVCFFSSPDMFVVWGRQLQQSLEREKKNRFQLSRDCRKLKKFYIFWSITKLAFQACLNFAFINRRTLI